MSVLCKVVAFICWIGGGLVGLFFLTRDFWVGFSVLWAAAVAGLSWYVLYEILENQEIIMIKLDRLQSEYSGVAAGHGTQNRASSRPKRSTLSKLSGIASETEGARMSFEEDEKAEAWSCKACGQKNPASTDYCNNCGKFRMF